MCTNKGKKHNPQRDPCGLKADVGPDCLRQQQESLSSSKEGPIGL